MRTTDDPSSLPKTTSNDWVYSTEAMPSARFWTPFDPGFGKVLSTLSKYIIADTNVLEIGFAPGKMLAWAACRKKAVISGVDYSKSGVEIAKRYMKALGLHCDLRHENVFQTTFEKNTFDVVYSVGVIEHFDHPKVIVQTHLDLAKIGGIVVMFVPNYGGLWGKIQKRLDPENLDIHNTSIMTTEKMTELMKTLNCEIIDVSYAGSFSSSILSLDRAMRPSMANFVHKLLNTVSTFLPFPIGRLAPQIVAVIKKS